MVKQSTVKVLCVILSIMFLAAGFAENDIKCGIREGFEAFPREGGRERPPNGPLYIYTPNFIIHYDTTGPHACTHAYAESVSVYAEFSRAKQVGGLGFAAPAPDTGGPDSRYDLYINNTYGEGYTWWGVPYPDPYPTGRAAYSYITNLAAWIDLCVIVAHEYNHGCQARYSSQYNWWYENTAVWMEDVCYDETNWLLYLLTLFPNPLASPYFSITTNLNKYEYAGQIWAMFLEEYYGFSSLRLIWEEIGQVGGNNVLSAIDSVLRYYESDLKTALGNYAIWRYFTGDRADTVGHFRESHLWPTSYVDPSHQHYGPGSGNHGTYPLRGPGGTSFIEFYTSPDYLLKNSLVGSAAAEWQVYNVGCSPSGHRHYMMDSVDYWSVLPTTDHDTIVLIPTVTTTATAPFTYDYTGEIISSVPTPPQDPDLEISSILSPTGTITPYSSVVPSAVRRNNATSTTIDTTWVSFYIGDWYGESHEIGPLSPGQTDTVSFADWTAIERNSVDVRCVGGGGYDVDIANNYRDTSALVTLSDFEVLEILSPRGVVVQNEAITPRAILRNNGTSGSTVFACFTIDNYADTNSIYLGPESSGTLLFDDWTPSQLEVCTTSCLIITPDERSFNNIIAGEFLVDTIPFAAQETRIFDVTQCMLQVEPNPFHHSADIRYQITDNRKEYKLKIYDISGRLVTDLSKQISVIGGQSSVKWSGRDDRNRTLGSGVYFVRLTVGDYTATEKLLLIK